jgi:hypothetical protein
LREAERIVDARYKASDSYFTSAAFSLPHDAVASVVASYKTWLDGIASTTGQEFPQGLRVFQSSFTFFPVTKPT